MDSEKLPLVMPTGMDRLTADRLRAFVKRTPTAMSADPYERSYRLCIAVLRQEHNRPSQ